MAKIFRRTGSTNDTTPPVYRREGSSDVALLDAIVGTQKIGLAYVVTGGGTGYYTLGRRYPLYGDHSKVYASVTGWRMRVATNATSRIQRGTSTTQRANLTGVINQEGAATWVPTRLYTSVLLAVGERVLEVLYASVPD